LRPAEQVENIDWFCNAPYGSPSVGSPLAALHPQPPQTRENLGPHPSKAEAGLMTWRELFL
ncbi:hypothetical protein B0H34DRAFT_734156, partial [Crassisporium funariophilum]